MDATVLGLSMRAQAWFSGVPRGSSTIQIEIVLRITLEGDRDASMLHPHPRGECTDAPAPIKLNTLATAPLDEAVEAWLDHLRARRKRPATIAAYRQQLRRALEQTKWSALADLTPARLVEYIDGLANEHAWKPSTYNRNLTAFRSLTAFLARTNRLASDPLATAVRAGHQDEQGSRPATTEEARALIRAAWLRQERDKRCAANRALYWACLFLTGARFSEPGLWRRRHLMLDVPVPHVVWSPDMQKARARLTLALAPELATLLRQHLARADEARARAGAEAATPDDLVFERRPSSPVWRSDMVRAEIEHLTANGDRFSPHSSRKWFSCTLGSIGCNAKMIDRLMRHTSGVDQRYYRPTLQEQVDVLQRLPSLWPEARHAAADGVAHGLSTEVSGGLTREGGLAQDRKATLGCRNNHDSVNPPLPAGPPLPTSLSRGTTERGLAESFGEGPREGTPVCGFDPRQLTGQVMAITGSVNLDPTLLADLLDALSGLLRGKRRDEK